MPVAFLCHASEDKPLARQMASMFMAAGVETFLDELDIGTGDSIRQTIDAGIKACTHFVVLLTPASVTKPWVQFELDAGVAGYLDGRNKLFPLRAAGLSPRDFPATLQGLNAPEIVDVARDLPTVIADMYGVSRKPALGPPPALLANSAAATESGLSPAAFAVAATFVRGTTTGRYGSPARAAMDVGAECALDDDTLVEALDELQSLGYVNTIPPLHIRSIARTTIMPTDRLFVAQDRYSMPWNTELDARTVAAILVNTPHGLASAPDIASQLKWTSRRLNPAMCFLVDHDVVSSGNTVSPEWRHGHIRLTPRTKRYLRDV